MAYLYGDSSASPFEVNYIDLLRRALEVLADVVQAESEIRGLHDERRRHEARARADEASLSEIGKKVRDLLGPIAQGEQTPATRCAGAIRDAAGREVDAEVSRVRGALSARSTELAELERGKRRACHQRLASLLADFDLPGMRKSLSLELRDAAPYDASLLGATDYDVVVAMKLRVPDDHVLSRPVRVQQLAPDLEIHLPETGGWLRKELRMVRHKLGKMYVAQAVVDAGRIEIALRNHSELEGAGYDVVVDRDEQTAAVYEVVDDGRRGERYDAGDDESALCAFAQALVEAIDDLDHNRGELVDLDVDERAITDDGDLAALVDRIVATMAPDVASIAKHSLSPDELVLRRGLSGDRREEVFASKADLGAILDKLAPPLRERFVALGLPLSDRPITSELEPAQILAVADQGNGVVEAMLEPADDDGWIEPADSEERDSDSERTRPHESAPHQRSSSDPVV